ncbi:glycosyl hydrolase family 35 [Bacillus sp. AFS076308]|uniref:beta-galactosidase n=1 Tax=unclassified Bacillus (in: firmicutes) TaxID=185979 RepID=UPI000BF544CE|nr:MULTISPECIES: beta-galactosidase [unclassified Bacillus (in: firmicutes)]PFO06586.1 glycosyl hydrolase family 35 [Bacillus sp. AFS076308]PGV52860.1 glycosyl hydrolase family 35 [Bacillus sp. AFS037270]
MRAYRIDVKNTQKEIYPLETKLGGSNIAGENYSFTNYYMEKNGRPFFGISGEFHFSRYNFEKWEDEIIKMKMGGINIIPTYIFWNHHEEEQGIFDWEANKNLRRFVGLCRKHGMGVILRIGPFAHGEARNGGIPDWLFGRPFDLRSNDKEYLTYVKRFYQEIGKQVQGFLFKEGGPIIGTQIENEYEHAGAPWEITNGTGNEWVPAGRDGDVHIITLKELAIQAGIQTPIYTSTGWGGAAAPVEEVLPLWGGYAFWPWIFYGDVKEHPATPEFIFRDYHNDQQKNYGFTPAYRPESLSFACCEMGGGMTVFYKYRFKLPYESVDAMAEMKVAGGCNFVGYYVFHGGSNPKGKKTPFLNENATPKISYDYQAPIGEFGQIRESYKRLKRQHYFYKTVEESFCKTKTVLPYDTKDMDPYDIETLRFAVRANRDSGFVFINNYQDHVETKDQQDFAITVNLENEEIRLPKSDSMSLAKDECCILPFNLDLQGLNLKYSTTQLLTSIEHDGEIYFFFFIPKGMNGEYYFESDDIQEVSVDNGNIISDENTLIQVSNQEISLIDIMLQTGRRLHVCTLTNEQSLNFWKYPYGGKEQVFITNATLLVAGEKIRLESAGLESVEIKSFPGFNGMLKITGEELSCHNHGLFKEYKKIINVSHTGLEVKMVNHNKAVIHFQPEAFDDVKELLLQIEYVGDIGYAFIDGKLIHDNFCNNDIWEIGLQQHKQDLLAKGMYIYISPLKEESFVKSDSPMAARAEVITKQIAEIKSIKATAIRELEIDI